MHLQLTVNRFEVDHGTQSPHLFPRFEELHWLAATDFEKCLRAEVIRESTCVDQDGAARATRGQHCETGRSARALNQVAEVQEVCAQSGIDPPAESDQGPARVGQGSAADARCEGRRRAVCQATVHPGTKVHAPQADRSRGDGGSTAS